MTSNIQFPTFHRVVDGCGDTQLNYISQQPLHQGLAKSQTLRHERKLNVQCMDIALTEMSVYSLGLPFFPQADKMVE